MKRLKSLVTVMILLLSVFSHAYAGDKPVKESKFDSKKTLELFHSFASRATFPDSVPFAYYNMYAFLALEGKVDQENKNKIVGFLKKCQKVDGGFVTRPEYAPDPNVIYSYYAVKTLAMLESLNEIDVKKATSFIVSLKQKDGGFKASHGEKDTANVVTTYYAVKTLETLKALDKIDKKKTRSFVSKYIDKKGKGFSMVIDKPSTPQSTLMGTEIAGIADGLTKDIKADVVTYLKGTRYSGLIKDKKYAQLPSVRDMAYVLETSAYLNATDQLDKDKMYEFVMSLYVDENGGFGPTPGLGTTPASSYQGVVCLVKLGKLQDPFHMK